MSKRTLSLIVALSATLAFPAHSLEIKGLTPTKSVVYKKVGDTELKLHIFTPPGHKPSDKRPASWSCSIPSSTTDPMATGIPA